jgi:hypothetical protein
MAHIQEIMATEVPRCRPDDRLEPAAHDHRPSAGQEDAAASRPHRGIGVARET